MFEDFEFIFASCGCCKCLNHAAEGQEFGATRDFSFSKIACTVS